MKQVESRRAKNRERDLIIIQAAIDGESMRSLGRKYGVNASTVLRIIARKWLGTMPHNGVLRLPIRGVSISPS